MITFGKKVDRKKITSVDNLYTQWRYTNPIDRSILLPKKDLKEYVKELKIDNGICKIHNHCIQFWMTDRKISSTEKNSWRYDYANGAFKTDFYLIQKGQITHYKSLCEICKDRLKGVVGECKDPNKFSYKSIGGREVCYYDLNIPETAMDLSSYSNISNGLLCKDNPFRQYVQIEDMIFDLKNIKYNLVRFKDRYKCGKLKIQKKEKYCSKCIFSCDDKLIHTTNVRNKCCLTYAQALKNGFFKDIKIQNSTSIYNGEILIKTNSKSNHYERLMGWNSKGIVLQENKYNNYGKDE